MILITGGAGYIGSHTVLAFLEQGHSVVVVDNLCNSHQEAIHRVEKLAGKSVVFIQADIRDLNKMRQVFTDYSIDTVIHFAGLKAVGESVEKPLEYYDNNVQGTLVLLQAMREANVKKMVFSSSATVYGDPAYVPMDEDCPLGEPTNPYGRSKYMIEYILKDVLKADPSWSVALLRYFNPVGAHSSGLIGEDPQGIPNNLVPYVAKVAVGKLPTIQVFGNHYPTPDGTGLRDYIHVVDLARGHLAAFEYLNQHQDIYTWNLGTGKGTSVLEVIAAFSKACGRDLPYQIQPRRAGDIAECYANCDKAKQELGWKAQYDIAEMMRDSWHWQSKNPNGFSNI